MPTLLKHLNDVETSRAQSLPLFANPDRLARKPRCSWTKDNSHIRTSAHALKHPYIQPNSPVAYERLVFDLDWHQPAHPFRDYPLRLLAYENLWDGDLMLPEPNWIVLSRDKNSAHIGYELKTPVGRHEMARSKPQQYLAAIESAMAKKLHADMGFGAQLCKNPLNEQWELVVGHAEGRDLNELAEYSWHLPFKTQKYNRVPCGEVGRNVYIFDGVRFWAYDHVEDYRAGPYENWTRQVHHMAMQLNASSFDHIPFLAGRGLLPSKEVQHISGSVARWTWKHLDARKLTATFSKRQSERGAKGAAKTASVKRERRESDILSAIGQLTAQGQLATMGRVAKLLGCSKSTLSEHYRHLFYSPVH